MTKSNILGLTLFTLVLLSNEWSLAQPSCGNVFGNLPESESIQSTSNLFKYMEESVSKLYETSGFKNDSEIIDAAKSTAEPIGHLYRAALEILNSENLAVGMRRGAKVRLSIARSGFLNSYEAGDSRGSVVGRESIEATYANMTADMWSALPAKVKPKYAAAFPKTNSNLLSSESLDSYTGTDKYYFKLERIRDRMTITPGDSLNRFKYWEGWGYEPKTPIFWDQLFIPWKHRFLLIPCLAEGLKEGRLGLPKLPPTTKYSDLGSVGNQNKIEGEGDLAPYKMKWTPNMDYLELQIWGKLTLDDVEVFEYGSSPPQGSFLKELRRRGIEIRDGRKK